MPVPPSSDFYSFVVSLKSGRVSPPTLFLFKIILDMLGPLHIHMNIRISLSVSTIKAPGILIRIVLNL